MAAGTLAGRGGCPGLNQALRAVVLRGEYRSCIIGHGGGRMQGPLASLPSKSSLTGERVLLRPLSPVLGERSGGGS
jgi:hypothetical protein